VIVVDASALVDFLSLVRVDPALDEHIATSDEFHALLALIWIVATSLTIAIRGERAPTATPATAPQPA